MRVYFVCAALITVVVTATNEDHPNYNNQNYESRLLEPIDVAADQETVNYLLPKLTAKYRPNNDWSGVTDPRFYLLTEMDSNDIENEPSFGGRLKRVAGRMTDASLSIVNSLDVLRNRLLLEIARKKAREGANRNRQFLMSLGKRGKNSAIYRNNV